MYLALIWPAAAALGGLVVAVHALVRQIRRALHTTRSATTHDVGPDALRLLEDLDAHLDEYLLDHPDVAAGFDRLRAAVRDEQQEGEQA